MNRRSFLADAGLLLLGLNCGFAKKDDALDWIDINNGSLDILALTSADRIDSSQTVYQREARIISQPKENDVLYTFGASTCSIIVAVEKDGSGKVEQIGLAHIDYSTSERSICYFYSKFTNPEIYIISGDKRVVERVVRNIDKRSIKGMNISEKRNDAAGIDGNGTLYYGINYNLISPDFLGKSNNYGNPDLRIIEYRP